jgi:GNAT superfamily N-acetyltransferase
MDKPDIMDIRTWADSHDFERFKLSLGPQTLRNFDHFQHDERYHRFFVHYKNSVIAYGFLRDSTHPHKKHLCVLGMVVADKWQGTGIGTSLGKYMIDWARGKYSKIALGVYMDNTKAVTFYRRLGFVMEGILVAEELNEGVYRDLVTMALYI